MAKLHCLTPSDRHTRGARADVLRAYMSLRLDYVLDMGWLDGITSDDDVYDDRPDTWYFVSSDGDKSADGDKSPARGRVAAGLRITKVASFRESLTWSMLDLAPSIRRQVDAEHGELMVELDELARRSDGGLWDLTRLVSPMDGSVSGPVIIQSVYELFGMATYKTVIEPAADPAWIFFTTPTVKRLFDMSGFNCQVLFQGRVGADDTHDSLLCIVRPKAVYDAIHTSHQLATRRAYKHVRTGCLTLQTPDLAMTGT